MKILYFDYMDNLVYEKFEKKFVNDVNDFYNEIINKQYDILIINFDFFSYFLEIRYLFEGYVIFLVSEINELIYKKCLFYGDYCYQYNELFKIFLRIEYLRKKIHNTKTNIYKIKNFIINLNTEEVYKNRENVKLTKAEKELLFYLIKNRNRYVPKEEIVESSDFIDSVDSVKVLISSLRKLGFEIENQKNLGYKIKE